MTQRNRNTIKNFFKKGTLPTESSFEDLVDSMVNIIDDGFLKNIDDGLMISPTGDSDKMVTFYKNIEFKNPAWSFELGPDKDTAGFNIKDRTGMTRFFIHPDGNVGIDTVKPRTKLEVKGVLASEGRVGTYRSGSVKADGSWQKILTDLDGSAAFEIVARVAGEKKSGKYALLYCIALSTFGRSKPKIMKVQASYGWFWNKIAVRWQGDVRNYSLQIKTRSNYGKDAHGKEIKVMYHITRLWDDNLPEDLFPYKDNQPDK